MCSDGESDGVRTRDRPVKSRVLYLTKLQTQPTDLTPLYNRNGGFVQSSLPPCLTIVSTSDGVAITTASHIPTNSPTSTTPSTERISSSS